MKGEKWLTALCATLLSIAAAVGTMGCFVTAFHLPLADSVGWIWVCVICSLICALSLCFRHGDWVLGSLLALTLGYLWRDGTLVEQGLQLVYRLCHMYDRAYDLGLLSESSGAWSTTPADWPIAFLAGLVSITVCQCLCRRTRVWPGVLACVLPLLPCIVVTDTVPAEGYLFLWMAAVILLILPAAVRRENALQGLRLTAMAVLPVLAFLAAVFLAVPQRDYVNRSDALRTRIFQSFRTLPEKLESGVIQMAADLRSGEPEQVDLRLVGPQIPFAYPVMEVTAEKSGILYLRGQDYDAYDGLGWSATKDRREVFGLAGPAGETLTITTRSALANRYLPYYSGAELIDGRAENPDSPRTYTLTRTLLPGDWRLTAYGSENAEQTPPELTPYLRLPQHTYNSAQSLLDGLSLSGSNTSKADAIAAFVTNCAAYDRNTPAMPREEEDFALWFLSESDTGYCIHFATAATVLLRSAGVPARYVTGYLTETKANEPQTVTEEDAHAWAEYYEPLLGCWIPLEATPGEPEESETQSTVPTQPQTMPSEPETQATRPVATETGAEIPQTQATAPTEVGDQIPQEVPKTPWFALLLVPILLVTMATQRALRLEISRNRCRSGSPNAQALARWREAVRLSRLLRDSPPEELLVLAQKAKFSNHQLKSEELQLFDGYIRSCHRQLKKKSSLHQLLYRYVYAVY